MEKYILLYQTTISLLQVKWGDFVSKYKRWDSTSCPPPQCGNHCLVGILNNGVSEVLQNSPFVYRDTVDDFPATGSIDKLYMAISSNKLYRWDNETLQYVVVGSDYSEIQIIDGGKAEV